MRESTAVLQVNVKMYSLQAGSCFSDNQKVVHESHAFASWTKKSHQDIFQLDVTMHQTLAMEKPQPIHYIYGHL